MQAKKSDIPPATPVDNAALALYLSVMEEVKARAFSINTATNVPNGLPAPLIREYCFLQLRMLCELIALGCLVAHGDIKEAQSLQTKWHPAVILKELERLHPDFYPVPVKPVFSPNAVHLDDVDSDFLTKPELLALYGRCGDELHMGNLKQRILPKTPTQNDYSDVSVWGQKLLNLLSAHRIIRRGSRFGFLTFLEVTQMGGNVQVGFFASPEPAYKGILIDNS